MVGKWLRMWILGVLVALMLIASGCSTLHYGGEGLSTGALVGAGVGYAINGPKGAYIGAATGGLIGHWVGASQPKPKGVIERDLALGVKGDYYKRTHFDVLTAKVNGASNCVAKGLGEAYCRRLYELEVE